MPLPNHTYTNTLPYYTHIQSTPPPSIPSEGSVTSSDYSAGFNDVLSSLHTTLSRELDGQEVGVTNPSNWTVTFAIELNIDWSWHL